MPSLYIYVPTLEAAMGTEKRKGNLDFLLAILADQDYDAIGSRLPRLVKPINEFVSTRSLKPNAASGESAGPEGSRSMPAVSDKESF
jgi:hypothetical protein